MELKDFYNKHKGETCLLVGLGENLYDTPPEWFDYPSFGVNTIYRYTGWKPTYFVGVDHRLFVEDGEAITEQYADIPKFIPRPNRDEWRGDNFFRFLHCPGELLKNSPASPKFLDAGLSYTNVMHVALQTAWHMGFTTVLMIGIHYKPGKLQNHFWGCDHKAKAWAIDEWFRDYREIVEKMQACGIRVLNISDNTHLPADIIPHDDWKKWRNNENQNDRILQGQKPAQLDDQQRVQSGNSVKRRVGAMVTG